MTRLSRHTKGRDINALIARAKSDAESSYPRAQLSENLFNKALRDFENSVSYPLFYFIYTSRFTRTWLDMRRRYDIVRR